MKRAKYQVRCSGKWLKGLLGGILMVCLSFSVLAQQTISFQLAHHFDQSASMVASDPLGFFYLFQETGELLKVDSTGREQFRYSTTREGELGYFDTYNGMQILCWFPDFQKIIFLNRTLQPEAEILLSDLSIPYATAVKTALDGNVWVYDENNFQLKKISSGSQEVVTGNRLDLILGEKWQPVFMVEYENAVYLTDPEKGILVLDVFGNYVKTLPLTGIRHFFIRDNNIYFLKNFLMWRFDLLSLLDYSSKAPEQILKAPRHFWEGKFWFQIFPDQIKVFRYRTG
jgi:hypothetical protein